MTLTFARQAQMALCVGAGALVLAETQALAAVTAKDLTFEGSWLIAVSAVAITVIALWLTCLGALRSDRRDRGRATSGTADRTGTVFGDIDGQMRVH